MRRPVACALALSLAVGVFAYGDSKVPVVSLTLPSGKVLRTEVMRTPEQRARGLMHRPSLSEDQGMLFVFDVAGFHSIWMKNCKFPIDILWLDGERQVVHFAEAVPPCKHEPCPVYEPLRKSTYVVELNAGQARREQVGLGSVIRFELPR